MGGGLITGVTGYVKWSYYTAGQIEKYTVTRSPEHKWTLRGTVVLSDAFKMSQKPLVFVAPHEGGAWTWPIVSHELVNGQMVAVLGPPDKK